MKSGSVHFALNFGVCRSLGLMCPVIDDIWTRLFWQCITIVNTHSFTFLAIEVEKRSRGCGVACLDHAFVEGPSRFETSILQNITIENHWERQVVAQHKVLYYLNSIKKYKMQKFQSIDPASKGDSNSGSRDVPPKLQKPTALHATPLTGNALSKSLNLTNFACFERLTQCTLED